MGSSKNHRCDSPIGKRYLFIKKRCRMESASVNLNETSDEKPITEKTKMILHWSPGVKLTVFSPRSKVIIPPFLT
jgi:hypothetical protein